MIRQAMIQRWACLMLLGVLVSLLLMVGVPAVAYRVTLSIEQARHDAQAEALARHASQFVQPPHDPQREMTAAWHAFHEVSDRVKPAVVHIEAYRTHHNDAESPVTSALERTAPEQSASATYDRRQGSGIIIDARGLVLTNHALVAEADEIQVSLACGAGHFMCRVLGTDPGIDLALLEFQPQGTAISVAAIGNSDDLGIGDWVLALGNPFGHDQSVTAGIVSAKGQLVLPHGNDLHDYIQTDAAIFPVCSGGPLVNLRGEVVGINTLRPATQGMGIAVPSNLARDAIPHLLKYGRLTRGWFGIFMHCCAASETEPRHPRAITVDYVVPGSPADQCGIRPRDVVLQIAGSNLTNIRDVYRYIHTLPSGTRLPLVLLRDGKTVSVQIELGTAPQAAWQLPGEKEWGLRLLSYFSPAMAEKLGLSTSEGVLIQGVEAAGTATPFLHPLDLITAINGEPVVDLQSYCEALARADRKTPVELRVLSHGTPRTVLLDYEPANSSASSE